MMAAATVVQTDGVADDRPGNFNDTPEPSSDNPVRSRSNPVKYRTNTIEIRTNPNKSVQNRTGPNSAAVLPAEKS